MEKLAMILAVISACFSMAGSVSLIASIKDKGITANIIAAAFYALAVTLRLITFSYAYSNASVVFLIGTCFALVCDITIMLFKKR